MSEEFSSAQIDFYRNQALEFMNRATKNTITEMLPQGQTVKPEDVAPESSSTLEEFSLKHIGKGSLRVQVSSANGLFPVPDASVEVSLILPDNKYVLYNNVTDQSGISDNMSLAALPDSYSQSSVTAAQSGTEYNVSIFHPAYKRIDDIRVVIYDNIETILPVSLQPQLQDNERGNS